MLHSKRRGHSHEHDEDRRGKKLRFVDIEAEVEDEGEDEGEDDSDDFDIIDSSAEIEDQGDGGYHARLHTRRQLKEDQMSLEDLAKQLTKRYNTHLPSRFTGDTNQIPRMLLTPSVNDLGLWQIRVKVSFCSFIIVLY